MSLFKRPHRARFKFFRVPRGFPWGSIQIFSSTPRLPMGLDSNFLKYHGARFKFFRAQSGPFVKKSNSWNLIRKFFESLAARFKIFKVARNFLREFQSRKKFSPGISESPECLNTPGQLRIVRNPELRNERSFTSPVANHSHSQVQASCESFSFASSGQLRIILIRKSRPVANHSRIPACGPNVKIGACGPNVKIGACGPNAKIQA